MIVVVPGRILLTLVKVAGQAESGTGSFRLVRTQGRVFFELTEELLIVVRDNMDRGRLRSLNDVLVVE